MLNTVELIGRLGADPEVRSLRNGGQVCNLRVATEERWTDDNNQRRERTTWHTVEIFGKGTVGAVEKYLRKGSLVHVAGILAYDEYEKDGVKQVRAKIKVSGPQHKIIFLDKKASEQADDEPGSNG